MTEQFLIATYDLHDHDTTVYSVTEEEHEVVNKLCDRFFANVINRNPGDGGQFDAWAGWLNITDEEMVTIEGFHKEANQIDHMNMTLAELQKLATIMIY